MKKILNFFLLLTIFIISCKTSNILYDRYNGDIISIIKILGKDYKVKTYIVNQNYEFLSEIEPDYFMYFTEDEMKRDVIVYEYIWKKKKKNIIVWVKEENGMLKAFSSVEYGKNIRFWVNIPTSHQ